MPKEIIENNGKETQFLWKDVLMYSLEIGLVDSNLAMISLETLDRWFRASELGSNVLTEVLPKLQPYLIHSQDVEEQSDKQTTEIGISQDFLRCSTKVFTKQELARKVLEVLGNIGSQAHQMVAQSDDGILKDIKWDPVNRIKFTLPLHTQKVDLFFDPIMP
jgi:hypothetical protein